MPDLATKYHLDERTGPARLGKSADGRSELSSDKERAERFWRLCGKVVSVRSDGKWGITLIDYREHLPTDLPPLLILDASGRVRRTYDWWKRHRKNLVSLRSARKNYDNLTIHVWHKGGSKDAFRRNWDELVAGVARMIETKPEEHWLVVHHKEAPGIRDITKVLPPLTKLDPDRLHFLSWGRHDATNEFVDVPNVVLAGTLFQRPSTYEAIGRAAADYRPAEGELKANEEREIARGELQHLILQALCRGSVRRCQGDSCAPANAYVVAHASHIHEDLRTTFPGCKIVPWMPSALKLSGKVRDAADFILKWFQGGHDTQLPFKEVYRAIGMTAPNFTNGVRLHATFQEWLASVDIVDVGMPFIIGRPEGMGSDHYFTPSGCWGARTFELGRDQELENYGDWQDQHTDTEAPASAQQAQPASE